MLNDTITAIATALQDGAISIIRISGDQAIAIADALFDRPLSQKASHTVTYGFINDPHTGKQVDDLESEIAVLDGQIAAAEQNYRQTNESVRCEMNTLDVQISQTEDKLRKCRITAPVSGTVLEKYAEEGETVTSGRQLFKLADMDNVYVRAYFTSSQLSGLGLGDHVRVMPDDGTEEPRTYEGTVTWISEEAEFTPKNIQTRDERADLVYAVKIAVRNDGRLRLGMYAYVFL